MNRAGGRQGLGRSGQIRAASRPTLGFIALREGCAIAAADRIRRRACPRWSDLSAVVSPVQDGLALSRSAAQIARRTGSRDLYDVSSNSLPALDLTTILLGHSTPHVIAAIPLKPSTRVIRMDPTFPAPLRQWLAGVDPEEIECTIPALRGQLCSPEPTARKFFTAIGHILAAEYAELEHLLGRKFRTKFGSEMASDRSYAFVSVAALHFVIDYHYSFSLCHDVKGRLRRQSVPAVGQQSVERRFHRRGG
jgi:hypothetical protein